MPDRPEKQQFESFSDFYVFYLSEHQNQISRRLHVVGTSLVILLILGILVSKWWTGLVLLPIVGYGFAWVGHFFFEKNKPATFAHPIWSLASDFVMWKEVISGRISW